MKNQVQKHVSYSPSEEWSYLLLRINLTKCPTHIFISNDHCPISPAKMVLSTQGQTNYIATIKSVCPISPAKMVLSTQGQKNYIATIKSVTSLIGFFQLSYACMTSSKSYPCARIFFPISIKLNTCVNRYSGMFTFWTPHH